MSLAGPLLYCGYVFGSDPGACAQGTARLDSLPKFILQILH